MTKWTSCRSVLSIFAILAAAASPSFAAPLTGDAEKGKPLYAQKCAVCHGPAGEGDGSAAFVLFPKPRNLARGVFKIRSTPSLPTDEDLFKTITEGMPGTAMPGWASLTDRVRLDLIAYIKTLSRSFADQPKVSPLPIPPAPKSSPFLLKIGKDLYVEAGCLDCHGPSGKGDGPSAPTLKDEWGFPIIPYDFTIPGRMKGGNGVADVYRTLVNGIGGTPMPSFADTLSEEQMWGLAYYVMSLAGKPRKEPLPETQRLEVRRVTGGIPVDSEAPVWRKASLQGVPLRTLWLRSQTVEEIRVAGLHNGEEVGFLLEWDDPLKNQTVIGIEEFRDACAVEFPLLAPDKEDTSYVMGKVDAPVNIWQWKADRQIAVAGNVAVSVPPSAVENLIAAGVGTITSQAPEAQVVRGEGKWAQGKWRVVVLRKLKTDNPDDAQFDPGRTTAVAFAVWDGAQSDRNGRKAVSVWQPLHIETGK